jgi:hypothetical protein
MVLLKLWASKEYEGGHMMEGDEEMRAHSTKYCRTSMRIVP